MSTQDISGFLAIYVVELPFYVTKRNLRRNRKERPERKLGARFIRKLNISQG
jgi:hypothetical protein